MIEDHDKDEGFQLRPPPPCPYILTKTVLEASRALLIATFEAHANFAKRRLESCCFWYGTLVNEHRCRVQAVLIPVQRNSWGNYHVSSAAMAEVSQATRPLGFLNLAQIHTHPGSMVEHSTYDDLMANSRRALSLVLPRYGIPDCKWPNEIGVHEHQADYWHRLNPEQSIKRIALVSDYGPIQTLNLSAP